MLTAQSAGQLPVVRLTPITATTKNVRQTDALPGLRVAGSRTAVRTQNVAHARYTHTHSRTNDSRSCFCKQPKTYLFSLNCLCFNYPSYSTGGANVHPHLLHSPWTHQSHAFPWVHLCPRPKRHLDRFSRFCRAHDRDRPTD